MSSLVQKCVLLLAGGSSKSRTDCDVIDTCGRCPARYKGLTWSRIRATGSPRSWSFNRFMFDCDQTREMEWDVIIAVISQLSNCEISPKKRFRCFNGIRTRSLRVRAAVLYHLSYEDPYTGDRPISWVHQPVKGMKHRVRWIVNCANSNEIQTR